jgi:hypothetical protein
VPEAAPNLKSQIVTSGFQPPTQLEHQGVTIVARSAFFIHLGGRAKRVVADPSKNRSPGHLNYQQVDKFPLA